MPAVAFVKSLGDLPLEKVEPHIALRDLPAEALYASGATNHETLFQLRDYPAEALFASGATNHDYLMSLRGLAAEALHISGATAHDTSGFAINSPYVCPEEGTGVITDYSV